MGILLSIGRFLGCKTGKESERPLRQRRQNQYPPNGGDSSEKLPKIVTLIYKAIKGLLQKVRFIIFYLPRPRKAADPILPFQNPAPSISNDPLFFRTLPISSPGINDSSADPASESPPATFAPLADSETDDQELQCDNVYVVSSQQWPPENNSATRKEIADSVIISIPTYSLAHTSVSDEIIGSAVFLEEIAPQNVPCVEENRKIMMNSGQEERQEEEEAVIVKSSVVVVDEGRWIKHYSSRHRILLVGDGDFSFSACLAVSFGCASNMIATSLNSIEFLNANYRNAPFSIDKLRSRGCKVMHGIDATKMANHELLGDLKFDRIIFNFPFAGFFKHLSRESQLRRHRILVSKFLKNAREMISEDGEIHISHKINDFHMEWKLVEIASSHRLGLIEAVRFNHREYPGYNTKCGFGGDNNFNCNPSQTYKFGLIQNAP